MTITAGHLAWLVHTAYTAGVTHQDIMDEIELGITTWRCNP